MTSAVSTASGSRKEQCHQHDRGRKLQAAGATGGRSAHMRWWEPRSWGWEWGWVFPFGNGQIQPHPGCWLTCNGHIPKPITADPLLPLHHRSFT